MDNQQYTNLIRSNRRSMKDTIEESKVGEILRFMRVPWISIFVITCNCSVWDLSAQERVWTRNDGKSVKAELEKTTDTHVTLKFSNGIPNYTLEISSLSKEDQEFIAEWTKRRQALSGFEDSAMNIASATKDRPFVNSLGMPFVPVRVSGSKILHKVFFCAWETRIADYKIFLNENSDPEWKSPHLAQDNHPVVNVSYTDAVAFCKWLTDRDRKKEILRPREFYRLPTDHEWSCAVGIGRFEDPDKTPRDKRSDRSNKIEDLYPWGKDWPPPKGAGNFAGEESSNNDKIIGYNDGFPEVAPVGSLEPNQWGIYNLAGNVAEFCHDWLSNDKELRVLRGGYWNISESEKSELYAWYRGFRDPTGAHLVIGFRVVIVSP